MLELRICNIGILKGYYEIKVDIERFVGETLSTPEFDPDPEQGNKSGQ